MAIPTTQAEFCLEIYHQCHHGVYACTSPPIQQVAQLRDDASSLVVSVLSSLGYLVKSTILLPGGSAPDAFFDEVRRKFVV
jgi:hypothetical protein